MNPETVKKQLETMVGEFGYGEVQKILSIIGRKKPPVTKRRVSPTKTTSNISPRKKPDAIAVITSLFIDDSEKRKFLLHLAKNYEDKQFMPNVNHVRSFLMPDNDVAGIKSRQQVTVKIFKKLAAMDLAELRNLEFSGLYDPPKRLETYARAIENFGRARRQSR